MQKQDIDLFNNKQNEERVKNDDILLSKMHKIRFIVLFLSIMNNFANYYCYDLPNALSDLMFSKITHETETSILYNQLYSVISLPNIFLPFVGSILIYKFGIHITSFSLNLFVFIGQVIFTIAGYLANDDSKDYIPYCVALFGRFIYGIGGEILNVCQITIISSYFKNKELSFAIGMYYSCTWLAVSFWNYLVPTIASETSLGFALASSNFSWIISIISTIVFIFIDCSEENLSENKDNKSNSFDWNNIKKLPPPFWYIATNCFFIFAGFLFYNVSNEFFSSRYGFDQIESAKFAANSYILFIIFTPIFGFISDKYGHKITLAIISTVMLTISQLLFILIPSSTSENKSYLGYIPIMMIGLASAIYYASLFPMIPIVVKHEDHGTAFGINSSLINFGVSFGSILVGSLTFMNLKENTYIWVNVGLGLICLVGVVFSLHLWIYDHIMLDSILQKPSQCPEEISLFDQNCRINSAI